MTTDHAGPWEHTEPLSSDLPLTSESSREGTHVHQTRAPFQVPNNEHEWDTRQEHRAGGSRVRRTVGGTLWRKQAPHPLLEEGVRGGETHMSAS